MCVPAPNCCSGHLKYYYSYEGFRAHLDIQVPSLNIKYTNLLQAMRVVAACLSCKQKVETQKT